MTFILKQIIFAKVTLILKRMEYYFTFNWWVKKEMYLIYHKK